MDLLKIDAEIQHFEQLAQRYLRQDPVAIAQRTIDAAEKELDAWRELNAASFQNGESELNRVLAAIEQFKTRIAEAEQKVDALPANNDGAAIESRNALTRQRNELVQEHNRLVREHDEKQKAYNAKVRGFNEEQHRRHQDLRAIRDKAAADVKTYHAWLGERGLEQLFTDLTRLYAKMRQCARQQPDSAPPADRIQRARALRHELGVLAQQRQQQAEYGLLIVQAILGNDKESYLVVDNGATVTSITEEMVDVLGLRTDLDAEVELLLPHAIRIKARQIVIPRVAVGEHAAEGVKGVVLKESMPGVDGCLGMSFLHRFNYRIEYGRPPKLTLKPHEVLPPGDPLASFEIFISYKQPEDFAHAKKVYDVLTRAGYRVFLSEISMPELGRTDYQAVITRVLDIVRHFVLICSSGAHANRPWIEAEWTQFQNQGLSEKRPGNIVPVLCPGATNQQLPGALRRFLNVELDTPGWETRLVQSLPRYWVRS